MTDDMIKKIDEDLKWFINNPPRGYMKGLPGIRVFVLAFCVIGLLLFFSTSFVVGYQQANHLTTNSTLLAVYNSTQANGTGFFSPIIKLDKQISSTYLAIQAQQITAIISDILGMMSAVLGIIIYPITFWISLWEQLLGPILVATGFNLTIANLIVEILAYGIPLIVIISAYFLKDI